MSREVWSISQSTAARRYRQVREAFKHRQEKYLSRLFPHAPAIVGPALGPSFRISQFEADHEELAAILEHPAVLAAIDRPPDGPLVAAAPPPLRFPSGHERLATKARSRPAPVYDVVPFLFERDILELRLLTLNHVVDKFIVVESEVGHGGVRKALRLDLNDERFKPFAAKIHHVVIDHDAFNRAYPVSKRTAQSGYEGEDVIRSMAWRTIRSQIAFEPDAVIVYADLDEIPPPELLHWIRNVHVESPVRLDLKTLRYSFRWQDVDTPIQLIIFSPKDFDAVDKVAHRIRTIHGQTLGARGAVHLTSFLPPLALVSKFAMTTDWEPGILAYVRNEHDETARMMAAGRWFGRRLRPYDPERDRDGLVPWAARAQRARFSSFWNTSISG